MSGSLRSAGSSDGWRTGSDFTRAGGNRSHDFFETPRAMIWLAAIAPTVLLQRRNRATIFTLVLISLPVTSLALQSMLNQQVSSGKAVFEQLKQQSAGLADPRQGSYIDYGPKVRPFSCPGSLVFFLGRFRGSCAPLAWR